MDAAIIQKCADPSLKPAIVRTFLQNAGSDNPLSVVVKGANKANILIPAPRTRDEAMAVIRQYAGKAIVRVGVTQYPAGVGISDPSELNATILNPCDNIRLGTALFAKTYRIVVKWYGDERKEVLESALDAWRTGLWDGQYVFGAEDPGPLKSSPSVTGKDNTTSISTEMKTEELARPAPAQAAATDNPTRAAMRIDLSRIQNMSDNDNSEKGKDSEKEGK
jgi:hypothetical protein